MSAQLKTRITVDFLMTIALIVQMGYMIVGDLAHEIIGTFTIALWVVHNILHRRWYVSLGVGNYPPQRIINTVINILLLLSVIGIIVSAVILSSYVFSFLGIDVGMSFARGLHMVSVYWCFILSSLHLGLHWSRMVKIIRKRIAPAPSAAHTVVLRIAVVVLSGFGLFSFIKQQLGSYMFLRTMFVFFDFEQPIASFFFEYVSIMVLFSTLSYFISALIMKRRLEKKVLSTGEGA